METGGPGGVPPPAPSLNDAWRGLPLGSGGGTAALAVAGGRMVSIRGRIGGTEPCTAAGGAVGVNAGRSAGAGRPPSGGGGRDDFRAEACPCAAPCPAIDARGPSGGNLAPDP
jgi:hypothetical protein